MPIDIDSSEIVEFIKIIYGKGGKAVNRQKYKKLKLQKSGQYRKFAVNSKKMAIFFDL